MEESWTADRGDDFETPKLKSHWKNIASRILRNKRDLRASNTRCGNCAKRASSNGLDSSIVTIYPARTSIYSCNRAGTDYSGARSIGLEQGQVQIDKPRYQPATDRIASLETLRIGKAEELDQEAKENEPRRAGKKRKKKEAKEKEQNTSHPTRVSPIRAAVPPEKRVLKFY